MHNLSDEQLMQRYAADDMTAFEALYERYRGPLYRFFLRQVKQEAQANDLYQGTWEKIIAGRKKFREGTPFRAWAFRVAHNHLVDHFRSARPTTDIDQAGYLGVPPEQEKVMEQEQQRLRLASALLELPAEQRTAIMLKLEGGLGLDEIADVTGVGRETAKSRLRYATTKLKQVLANE